MKTNATTMASSSLGKSAMARTAFSLTEILIAMGIVVILAALLFPAARGSMDRAKSAKCIANLRSIGGALQAYVAENNGYIMPRALTNASGADRYWHARLLNQGYLTDPSVLYCPSFTPNTYQNAKNFPQYDVYKATGQTYGMRLWVAAGRSWSTTELAQPMQSIQSPSRFFLVADSYWDAWQAQGYSIAPGDNGQRAHLRHNKLANALFADGHVEAMGGNYFTNEIPTTQGAYSKSSAIPVWPQP